MRIIRGKYKTRRMPVSKSLRARPTTDFAKENLFNILENWYNFENLKVLDLFSGTGSISYEFASRGVPEVVAVEMDHRHHAFIEKVITQLEIPEVMPIKMDVFKYLESTHEKFDVIFADPPYDLENIEKIPELIIERNLLNEKATMIIEHGDRTDLSHLPFFTEKRSYGSVNFSIFEN